MHWRKREVEIQFYCKGPLELLIAEVIHSLHYLSHRCFHFKIVIPINNFLSINWIHEVKFLWNILLSVFPFVRSFFSGTARRNFVVFVWTLNVVSLKKWLNWIFWEKSCSMVSGPKGLKFSEFLHKITVDIRLAKID